MTLGQSADDRSLNATHLEAQCNQCNIVKTLSHIFRLVYVFRTLTLKLRVVYIKRC